MSETTKRVLSLILKTLLIGTGIFLVIKLIGYAVPFLIAFILASLIDPIVKAMKKWLKIPRKLGSIISILLVIGVIGTLVGLLVSRLVTEIRAIYETISATSDSLSVMFNDLMYRLNSLYIQLPTEVSDAVDKTISDLGTYAQQLLGPVAKGTLLLAFSLPQVLIFVIVTVMATYFMSSDKHAINGFLDRQIPAPWLTKTKTVLGTMFRALFGWLCAQGFLMLMTFSEVLIGLSIIGIGNALFIAILVAIVDILPILGTGTVLIPWGIISLATGSTRVGISLLLLYLIILIIRQIVEPKLVGSQIGIHPLLTLFSMYTGLQMLGVSGILLGPVTMLVLKYILEGVMKTEGIKGWISRTFGHGAQNAAQDAHQATRAAQAAAKAAAQASHAAALAAQAAASAQAAAVILDDPAPAAEEPSNKSQ